MANDVYCAFTGAIPDEADLPGDHPLEDEDLADLPVGWTRITIQTREPNPEWETILAVEQGMVKQIMDSIPKAQRKEATPGVRVQVAAQLAALKAATPPFNIATEIFHVAAGDDGSESEKGLTRLRELLGGDAADEADEADDAEATDEAASEEPTGA